MNIICFFSRSLIHHRAYGNPVYTVTHWSVVNWIKGTGTACFRHYALTKRTQQNEIFPCVRRLKEKATHVHITFGGAVIDGRTGRAVFNLPCPGSGNIHVGVGIVPQLVNVQNAGVVVKGHIQTGDIVITGAVVQDLHQFFPVDLTIGLEGTAAGTGHVHTDTHVFLSIIQNIDILEETSVVIS